MQESKPSLYPSLSLFLWFLVTGSQQNDNWKVPEVYNSIHMFWYQGSNSGQARVLPMSPAPGLGCSQDVLLSLALNLDFSSLSLLTPEITGMGHYTWLIFHY